MIEAMQRTPTAVVLALSLTLCACTQQRTSEGPIFPDGKQAERVLDVHVLRDETTITLTNTSTRALGPGMMWVNRWYGRSIDAIAPGQTVTFKLFDFRDRFGESFRAGGFFATDDPDQLVKCEVLENDSLTGLIVIGVQP